jgi:hypothetical protein
MYVIHILGVAIWTSDDHAYTKLWDYAAMILALCHAIEPFTWHTSRPSQGEIGDH